MYNWGWGGGGGGGKRTDKRHYYYYYNSSNVYVVKTPLRSLIFITQGQHEDRTSAWASRSVILRFSAESHFFSFDNLLGKIRREQQQQKKKTLTYHFLQIHLFPDNMLHTWAQLLSAYSPLFASCVEMLLTPSLDSNNFTLFHN